MQQTIKRLRPWFACVVCLFFYVGSASVRAQLDASDSGSTLQVIDTYAEVHSGPGRGYPIFYVIEQGETIELLTRRPDWYEIKAENGRVGWVKAAQIARTLQPTGEPVDLPSVSYGDYLKNSWRVGFTIGSFNGGDIDGADSFSANLGTRPFEWLAFDLEFGNFYDTDLQGDLYNFNFVLEPFSKWRASPVIILGAGKRYVERTGVQTADSGTDSFQLYGIGLHYYVGRRFVVRGEYRSYNISTLKTETNPDPKEESTGTWKIGFNTFF